MGTWLYLLYLRNRLALAVEQCKGVLSAASLLGLLIMLFDMYRCATLISDIEDDKRYPGRMPPTRTSEDAERASTQGINVFCSLFCYKLMMNIFI